MKGQQRNDSEIRMARKGRKGQQVEDSKEGKYIYISSEERKARKRRKGQQ